MSSVVFIIVLISVLVFNVFILFLFGLLLLCFLKLFSFILAF